MARSIGRGRCDEAISRFPAFGGMDYGHCEMLKNQEIELDLNHGRGKRVAEY